MHTAPRPYRLAGAEGGTKGCHHAGTKQYASSIRHSTSGIKHQASGIKHQAPTVLPVKAREIHAAISVSPPKGVKGPMNLRSLLPGVRKEVV